MFYSEGEGWKLMAKDWKTSGSCWRSRFGNEFLEIVVHTRHPKIGLPLEWLPDVVDAMRVPVELNDGKDEVLRLVEGIEDFVPSHCDGGRSCHATLHFHKAQAARSGNPRLNVVAKLFKFAISGHETELSFDLHDDVASTRRADRRVDWPKGRRRLTSFQFPKHAERN